MQSTDSTTQAGRTRVGREFLIRAGVTVAVVGGALLALLNVPGVPYDWSVWSDGTWAAYIRTGLWITLYVSLGSLVVALVLGVIVGLMRMSKNVVVHQLGTIYVELIRGTPLLVQIMIAYFCVALAVKKGLEAGGAAFGVVDASQNVTVWGIAVLGVFAGAYVAEIVRAALESIDPGQTEAALSQGMTKRQVFRLVLFPQALRRMIPPLTGQLVSLVKDSSLLSVIGLFELTNRAGIMKTSTYSVFEVLIPLAGLYLLITLPLSVVARRLELRLAA